MDILGDGTPVTLGLSVGMVGLGVLWGETRVHVSGLREVVRSLQAQVVALETRAAAAEVREGRMAERYDALAARLDRMENKLDVIIAHQQRHTA